MWEGGLVSRGWPGPQTTPPPPRFFSNSLMWMGMCTCLCMSLRVHLCMSMRWGKCVCRGFR